MSDIEPVEMDVLEDQDYDGYFDNNPHNHCGLDDCYIPNICSNKE